MVSFVEILLSAAQNTYFYISGCFLWLVSLAYWFTSLAFNGAIPSVVLGTFNISSLMQRYEYEILLPISFGFGVDFRERAFA